MTTPIYYIMRNRISATRTRRWWPMRGPRSPPTGDDVFFLTGTDEHGQKVERAAQRAGLATEVFADQCRGSFATCYRRSISPTMISSGQPSRGTMRRHRRCGGWCGIADSSTRTSTKVVLHCRRGLRPRHAAAEWPLSHLWKSCRENCGRELFFSAVGVSAAPPRPLPGQPRLPGAGGSSKRDAVVPAGRARGSQRQPDFVQMGHSSAGRSATGLTCGSCLEKLQTAEVRSVAGRRPIGSTVLAADVHLVGKEIVRQQAIYGRHACWLPGFDPRSS